MSDSVTLQDIYNLFQESHQLVEASHQRFQQDLAASRIEFDRRLTESDQRDAESRANFEREMAESRAEFDRRLAESDQRDAESRTNFDREMAESRANFDREMAESRANFDREMAESRANFDREMAESRAEFDRRSAAADRRLASLQQTVERTSREVANLTTRWGQFVENLVEPGIVQLLQDHGLPVVETYRRMKTTRGNLNMEIDIFAVNDDCAVAIEVKSRLSQRKVTEFLEHLRLFKQAFPHYQTYQIYGAIAGIEIDEGIDRYAYQRGLFVIRQSGDVVEIANDRNFRPAVW